MTEDSFERVTDFGNLYKAYRAAKSNDKYSNSRIKFEENALNGISILKKMLKNKTYEVDSYREFKIYEPKERVIKAGSFKDKIVQHSLCDNVLLPVLSNEFILTNYAGQVDKGTDLALKCLSAHMKLAYEKYGYNCWIVKGDIRKYFYSIRHDVLEDVLEYYIHDQNTVWLCEKFIDSVSQNIGLALGNQVDQVFALLMLSGFDHFVTGELGVKYYGRYMDDFYLIIEKKTYAEHCLKAIYLFIDSLGLELNGKTQLIPFKNGIRFCGFHTYVTKDGKVIRKLTNEKKRKNLKKYRKMAKLVVDGKLDRKKFDESFCSVLNHLSKGNCTKFAFHLESMVKDILKNEV